MRFTFPDEAVSPFGFVFVLEQRAETLFAVGAAFVYCFDRLKRQGDANRRNLAVVLVLPFPNKLGHCFFQVLAVGEKSLAQSGD